MPMDLKIMICGLGGQGVIFLTRLLANTAVQLGCSVMVSETHGMSQRGGSVVSHLKIGKDEAPLILNGTADYLYALEGDEAVRNLHYLRKEGAAFVNSASGLRPEVAEDVKRLKLSIHCLAASQIAVELGAAAVANVVIAGFSAGHPFFPLPFEAMRETLKKTAKRGLELNLKAIENGYALAPVPDASLRPPHAPNAS